jgi:SWIB/MDM2 domain
MTDSSSIKTTTGQLPIPDTTTIVADEKEEDKGFQARTNTPAVMMTTSTATLTPPPPPTNVTRSHNNSKSQNNLTTFLHSVQEQMKRMDQIEERIQYRCHQSRRRFVQLFDQQHQQQLYGIDPIYNNSNSNTNTNTTTTGTNTRPTTTMNIPLSGTSTVAVTNSNNSHLTDPSMVNTFTPTSVAAYNTTTNTYTGSTGSAIPPVSFTSLSIPTTATSAAATTSMDGVPVQLQQQQQQHPLPAFPYTRNSHARITIHHSYQPEVTAAGAMAALMQKQVAPIIPTTPGALDTTTTTAAAAADAANRMRLCKPSPPIWTLHIEGKLLIDHLDYQSASQRDTKRQCKGTSSATGNSAHNNKTVEYDSTVHRLCPSTPLKFTHFFNQVVVTFQTKYEYIDPKMNASSSTNAPSGSTGSGSGSTAKSNKKSRRTTTSTVASATSTGQQQSQKSNLVHQTGSGPGSGPSSSHMLNHKPGKGQVTEKELKSHTQQITWTLLQDGTVEKSSSSGNDQKNGSSPFSGTDMWSFSYTEPIPPDKAIYKVQSVVAVIELYRRYNYSTSPSTMDTTTSRYYHIISSALQNAFFPHHGPNTTDLLSGIRMIHRDNHNKPVQRATIPEIIHTFFLYIQDHQLILPDDGNNGDVVHCDTTLQQLLNMEQFSFSQLRTLLHQRQLIEPILNNGSGSSNNNNSPSSPSSLDPIRITYIMEQKAASTSLFPSNLSVDNSNSISSSGSAKTNNAIDNNNLSNLQVDMDIYVPHYFMYRAGALLQRMKLREQEYQSTRINAQLQLLKTAPTYSTNHVKDAANMTNAMTAQARRIVQQTVLSAREEDEKHVRRCIEEWIVSSQHSTNDGDNDDDNDDDGVLPTDMIPFVPLTLTQSAPPNSEAQLKYRIDARIDYLLQQLESSNIIPNVQDSNAFVQSICAKESK